MFGKKRKTAEDIFGESHLIAYAIDVRDLLQEKANIDECDNLELYAFYVRFLEAINQVLWDKEIGEDEKAWYSNLQTRILSNLHNKDALISIFKEISLSIKFK